MELNKIRVMITNVKITNYLILSVTNIDRYSIRYRGRDMQNNIIDYYLHFCNEFVLKYNG